MPDLEVRIGDRVIGRLREDAAGVIGFTYAPTWLAIDSAFPISASLPLQPEEYAGGPGHWFFANLLPEGTVRQAVCSRLGISVDNDLALLRAIGGECAGALSVVEPDEPPPDPEAYAYERLTNRRLQGLVSGDRVVPLLVGGTQTRLSLAGAQDKLPVALIDGRLHLPLGLAPSTHILKFPNPRFAHLTANEAYVLGLAARLGFDAVAAELFGETDPPSLLVRRYDRRATGDAPAIERLHQEDLCQALGLPAARKYEQEGGPTFTAAIELVRATVARPVVDVRRLIEWQAFNAVVGNSDGHGKNLAILRDESIRLAPFYDLLSTRQYDSLDRSLAMSVGGRRNPDELGRADWSGLAAGVGVAPRVVIELVGDVAERCEDVLDGWTAEFREQPGARPVLQTLPSRIRKRARRLRRALA